MPDLTTQRLRKQVKAAAAQIRSAAAQPPSIAAIYAWAAVTLWVSLALLMAVVYFSVRLARYSELSVIEKLVLLGGDALIFILVGVWLNRKAEQWHGDRIGLAAIIGKLALRGFGFSAIAALLTALLWLGRHGSVDGQSLISAFAHYGWANLLLDHMLYWLVAATCIPLPWLIPRAGGDFHATPEYVTLRSNGRIERLRLADIRHVLAADNYLELHGDGFVRLHRSTLAGFVDEFGGCGFVRIGRGIAIHHSHLQALLRRGDRNWEVHMEDGTIFPVARRYRRHVAEALQGRLPHLPSGFSQPD
jgi:hypothetical protein